MADEKTYTVTHKDTDELRQVTAREWRERQLGRSGYPATPELLAELAANDAPKSE